VADYAGGQDERHECHEWRMAAGDCDHHDARGEHEERPCHVHVAEWRSQNPHGRAPAQHEGRRLARAAEQIQQLLRQAGCDGRREGQRR
jgi:hypothetical protein